jgi:hypothetical protein
LTCHRTTTPCQPSRDGLFLARALMIADGHVRGAEAGTQPFSE